MRRAFVATLIAALALVSGCRDIAMAPAGSFSDVLLVTQEGPGGHFYRIADSLITRKYDFVISEEQGFFVSGVRAADLEDFPTDMTIVICGTLDTSTEVGRRIAELIGEDGVKTVNKRHSAILKKDDLPAPGQVTIIVTATDDERLEELLGTRGGDLRTVIETSCRERLRKLLFKRRNQELSDEFHRKYGFRIQFPYLYVLFSEERTPPGVELIHQPPARVLGVYWVDRKTAPTLADADDLFKIRSDYVWRRYSHDKMDRDKVSFDTQKLGPYDAVRMKGYWYNDDDVAGGYFETYFVYDENARLLWAVDLVVYAPGHPKAELVRELEAIAETFRHD